MIKTVKKPAIFSIILSLILLPHVVLAQTGFNRESQNPFKTRMYYFPSDQEGKIKAILFIQARTDLLLFNRSGDQFAAKYSFDVTVKNGGDAIVLENSWAQEFVFDSFKETLNTELQNFKRFEIELDAGIYNFEVTANEVETGKSFAGSGTKILPSFWNEKLGISDIVLTKTQPDIIEELPGLISSEESFAIDFSEGFYVNHQIFSPDLQPFKYTYKVINFNDNTTPVMEQTLSLTPDKKIIDINLPIKGENLPSGTYLFQANVRKDDGTEKNTLLRFTFSWDNRPVESFDVDEAIQQMRYLIKDTTEWNRIQALSLEEKNTYFEDYWKEKDPTPGTGHNELFQEYFRRIEHTVQNFTAPGKKGWETARGKVYIIYGEPDVKSPAPLNTEDGPSLRWTYFNARKRFIFVDRTGNGDFELLKEEPLIRGQ